MRSEAPPLLPIFRSRTQADLLAWLFLHPEREYSGSDLAERLAVSSGTVHGETKRLIEHGILRARAIGRARLMRPNTDSPLFKPLSDLLLVTFGPRLVVQEEFAHVAGAERVILYGSWAARYEGHGGPMPADIDVMVVGTPDRGDVYAAADRSQARLEIPVNPTVRRPEQWETDADALVVSIKAGPTVELVSRTDAVR